MACLVGNRNTEVDVEVALVAGGPVEAPAHPAAVGEQLVEWRVRDADHRDVAGREVWEQAVEAVGRRRAGRAACAVVRPEHEGVGEELRAAGETLGKRAFAVMGVEAILLLEQNPWEPTSLLGYVVAEPREFFLAHE